MFCEKCGKEIPDSTKFCPSCGAPVSKAQDFVNKASEAFNAAEQELGSAFDEVKQSFTGNNANQQNAGYINTNFNKVLGLMLSNGLVAMSSALLGQYQGFADINMGKGAIVIGLAAVIIGEAIFGKIFKNFALSLLAVAFGSVIYYIVIQFVLWLGIDPDLLKLLSALVVAVFLAIPYWKGKYFNRPKHVDKADVKKEA